MKKKIFAKSHAILGAASHDTAGPASRMKSKLNGESHPPKKISAETVETRIMFAYSARKNIANDMPEYSIMWPATISDSPSTTSNGARLVSAMPETK